MAGLLPVGVDAFGSFTFFIKNELIIENLIVPAETEITLLSVELGKEGENFARCRLTGQQEASVEFHMPFSYHGEFYECQNDRGYSLPEIMDSARLCKRRFCSINGSLLVFSPVYQIQGIMHSMYYRSISPNVSFFSSLVYICNQASLVFEAWLLLLFSQ